jgi:hypothetical protein
MTNGHASSLLPVTDGTLTIDGAAAPGPVLADQLVRCTGGSPLTVRNAKRTVTDGSVTVTGTTDFLNVPGVPVTAVARDTPAGPVVSLRFALIEGVAPSNAWRFSRSFTALPAFAAGTSIVSKAAVPAVLPNFLDTLVLSDAAFVLTTETSGTDPVTDAPVRAGLNFVSRAEVGGFLGLLGSMIGGGHALKLHGPVVLPKPTEVTLPLPALQAMRMPWQQKLTVPGIMLQADLGVDSEIGSTLRLDEVMLRVYSPPSSAWAEANPTYAPMLAASAKLSVPSAEMSLDVTALGIDHPSQLSVFGTFEGVSIGKLAAMADMAGGGDLSELLPDDVRGPLQALGKIELQAISLGLGRGTIRTAGFTIGIPNIHTEVLPGFKVDDLSASFSVVEPFGPNRAVAMTLGGHLEFLSAPFAVAIEFPDVAASAYLTSDVAIPLHRLFEEAGLPAPPDLTMNALQLEIAKDGSFGVAAMMAHDPPWTLDLGPTALTVKDITVVVNRGAGGGATGRFGGAVSLGELELAFAYQSPGDFVLRSVLPDVSLMQLVRQLANQPVELPGDFDIHLTDSSVLIQKTGTGLDFQLATTVEGLGTVAFEAKRVGAQWGFAAGISATNIRLGALPGLSALSAFDQIVQLSELVVVVSSFDDPGFQFPAIADFAGPAVGRSGSALAVPTPSGGVIAGLNVHATWTFGTSQQQQLLKKMLGLSGSIGITLQVGADPAKNSRLYVGFTTTVAGLMLSGQFGVKLVGGEISLYLQGTLIAPIQGRNVRFDVVLEFVPNGAFISGSMLGTIDFEGIKLSNLAVAIGIDWEGIPSFGIACTLAIESFQSSLAIFFDSTDPARSLVAGAVSDLSLKDVVETFTGSAIPAELADLIPTVALVGTEDFTIDASLASALDGLDLPKIATAFAAHGIALPSRTPDVVLVVGTAGSAWFITDVSTMLHYRLSKQDGGIRVTLDPQFYLVPQTSTIGALKFDQGILLKTALKLLFLTAHASVVVKPSQGITVDGSTNRIVILTENLFSLQSADGTGGPRVSAATFSQPNQSDPALRDPHFLLDGSLTIMGVKQRTYVTLSQHGFAFQFSGAPNPLLSYTLSGHFNSFTDLGVAGGVSIGIGDVDLGPLGHVNIGTGVQGAFSLSVSGSTAEAKVAGKLAFAGASLELPDISLDVNTGSLLHLPEEAAKEVIAALKAFLLGDAERWAKLVGEGIVTGVKDVAAVLESTFGMAADKAKELAETVYETAKGCAMKTATALM